MSRMRRPLEIREEVNRYAGMVCDCKRPNVSRGTGRQRMKRGEPRDSRRPGMRKNKNVKLG